MINIRHDYVTLTLPKCRIDVNGAMRELMGYIRAYFDEAGPILIDKIKEASFNSVAQLPAMWAVNFNNSLFHTVTQAGQYLIELTVDSHTKPDVHDPEYMQFLVMEFGAIGVHAGPQGRLVWGTDKLTSRQHSSTARAEWDIPQWDHTGDAFFDTTVRAFETQFFDGLSVRLEWLFANGFFYKHIIIN